MNTLELLALAYYVGLFLIIGRGISKLIGALWP